MFLLRNVGILFVNGKRRGLRVRGRALIKTNPAKRRARKGKMPPALAKYWRAKKAAKRKPAKGKPARARTKTRRASTPLYRRALRRAGSAAWRGAKYGARAAHSAAKRGVSAYRKARARRRVASATTVIAPRRLSSGGGLTAEYGPVHRNPGRKANRSKKMAKGSTKRSRAAKAAWRKKKAAKARRSRAGKKRWRARRAAGKAGRIGHTRMIGKGRKSKSRKRTRSNKRRARRAISTKRRRAAAHKGWAKRRGAGWTKELEPWKVGKTKKLKKNPGRRRRYRRNPSRRRRSFRRNPSRRRRYRRNPYRRYARRHYRRNPGNMFVDLLKRAIPVVASFYGTRAIVARVAPMLPGVSSLGSFAGPVVGGLAVLGANYATRKFSMLAKHRQEIMLGVGFSLVDSLFQAFAPASVKAMIGMSDYVQMGDYIAVGATPIDDNMTLSDYIAVGGDGVQEELGLEEELGSVQEELGTVDIGGVMGGGRSLLAPVPSQSFLKPIPDRSFTKVIPAAGTNYDNAGQLYGGIFGGRFGN